MYNTAEDFIVPSDHVHCAECDDTVNPRWDHAEGVWTCAQCYAELPDGHIY